MHGAEAPGCYGGKALWEVANWSIARLGGRCAVVWRCGSLFTLYVCCIIERQWFCFWRYLGSSASPPPPPLCAVQLLKGRVPMHRDANWEQERTEACDLR